MLSKRLTLLAGSLLFGGQAAQVNAEQVLVIKARPLIVKRLPPDTAVARGTRKPDPRPIGTSDTPLAPRVRIASDTGSPRDLALDLSEAPVAVTEEDLLAAPTASDSWQDKRVARASATRGIVTPRAAVAAPYGQVVRREVVPRVSWYPTYWAPHPYPGNDGYDGYHGYGYSFSYGCHPHWGHRHHVHSHFGIGFHFRF